MFTSARESLAIKQRALRAAFTARAARKTRSSGSPPASDGEVVYVAGSRVMKMKAKRRNAKRRCCRGVFQAFRLELRAESRRPGERSSASSPLVSPPRGLPSTVLHRPPPSSTVLHRPPPSSTILHRPPPPSTALALLIVLTLMLGL
jgi:hypothetical protein